MFFAFFANIMVAGIVMTEGTRIMSELTEGRLAAHAWCRRYTERMTREVGGAHGHNHVTHVIHLIYTSAVSLSLSLSTFFWGGE